ncbi:MAG: hypothetical protein PHC60_03195 [Heliobacteriaceae bacterium]|nr:hypothetical protein [Heliobacteriaceae bacterium]MDD4587386.1 hypothetical protein [Heliobacteriaceae bacterium]
MALRIWKSLLPELAKVQAWLDKEMQIRSGHVGQLMGWPASYLEQVSPASLLVLLIARMFGDPNRQAAYLANVVQLIDLAMEIHRKVPDEEAAVAAVDKNGIPFSVLVGDLLYGQFFAGLCRSGLLEFLSPLSVAICRMHEGGMMRKELAGGPANTEKIETMRELEFASLPVAACRLAGQLSGALPDQIQALERLGQAIGLLNGAVVVPASPGQISAWLGQALDALKKLPPGRMREACRDLLDQLSGRSGEQDYRLASGLGKALVAR